ncbi:MAG: hypothetical protein Q8N69_01495, partial [bacterium]|nr:hypothetical protein [bacterium]
MKKILYLFLILTLFPAASFAQQGRDAGNKTATCSKIMEKLSNAQRALNGSQEKIRNRQGDINGNIENRRENRILQMEKIRNKWSQNRADHFEKLRERAQTEEQKQAVEGFVIAVESALIIRQEAFDRAIRDYQVEFDALAESRQSEVKQRAEDYKTAVEKA